MIAIQLTSVQKFMHALLLDDTFDIFLLEKAQISTYNTFEIDGKQNENFYTAEEWNDSSIRPYAFSRWKDIRPLCFELIRGTRTPTGFKFVLQLCPEYIKGILIKEDTSLSADNIKSLLITLKYDGSRLTLITGTSLTTFIPGHSLDKIWDRAVLNFLSEKQLPFELL